jgi:enoyl-CoA hydratase/carnithine racemase
MTFVNLTSRDGIAHLVLNRPDEKNKITTSMMRTLTDKILEAEEGRAAVLLITGKGSAFSMGRDQTEQLSPAEKAASLSIAIEANQALRAFRGAAVAAVQGCALGFACGVVVQCDLSIVADTAVLGFDETKHGFIQTIVLSYIQDYVPKRHVPDLILTGRSVGAYEAREMGLVNWVVPEDHLEAHAHAI